jgi:hypothetical protein
MKEVARLSGWFQLQKVQFLSIPNSQLPTTERLGIHSGDAQFRSLRIPKRW